MKLGAIDLGSGTTKLSIFEKQGDAWKPLDLTEINTELRKGMGPELLLQGDAVERSLEAVEELLKRAAKLGVTALPTYGTSALRKAKNRELLFRPLRERFDIECVLLSEEEEGRLNLLGAQASSGRKNIVVVDPGGDSTDCAFGEDWQSAHAASLPFGSVSLQERFGHEKPGDPIPQEALEELKAWVKVQLDAFAPAQALKKSGLLPAIHLPAAKALKAFHGMEKERYQLDDLRLVTVGMASMPHEGRIQLIAGEPVGKVDRTPFGFASLVALLEWMEAGTFVIERYGIKLGAALYLGNAWQK
jgi:exopolyphosphatase/pppGpp-phosphohydrolase